jgi:hypothetical protein
MRACAYLIREDDGLEAVAWIEESDTTPSVAGA